MKNIFTCIILCYSPLLLAQIPINKGYFPKIGDKSYIATATRSTVQNMIMSINGGNQFWDFRQLEPQTVEVTRFTAPDTEGDFHFPKANLTWQLDTTRQMPFYHKTDSTLTLLGFWGIAYQGYFLRRPAPLYAPLQERRAPLFMGSHAEQLAGYQGTFSKDIAPDSLLRQSPFTVPDSFRIHYRVWRKDTIDAWGIMALPNGNYPVLRERRYDSIDVKIEMRFRFSAWTDITTLVLSALTEPFQNKQYSTYFWSNNVIEPIAILETDSLNRIRNIQYKVLSNSVSTKEQPIIQTLKTYPNPAKDALTLDLPYSDKENLSIILMDMLGRTVLSEKTKTVSSASLSLKNCPNGLYKLYVLDELGRLIGQQSVVVQK